MTPLDAMNNLLGELKRHPTNQALIDSLGKG